MKDLEYIKELLERIEKSNNKDHDSINEHLAKINGTIARHNEFFIKNENAKEERDKNTKWRYKSTIYFSIIVFVMMFFVPLFRDLIERLIFKG